MWTSAATVCAPPVPKLHACAASLGLQGSSTTVLRFCAVPGTRQRPEATLTSTTAPGTEPCGSARHTRVSGGGELFHPRFRMPAAPPPTPAAQDSKPTSQGMTAPSSTSLRACTPSGSWLIAISSGDTMTACMGAGSAGRSAERSSGAFMMHHSPNSTRFSPRVRCGPRFIMSGSLKPPGPARGAHLSLIDARFSVSSHVLDMSLPTRQRLAKLEDCRMSGEIEKGSIEYTMGALVRSSASRVAAKRTEGSIA